MAFSIAVHAYGNKDNFAPDRRSVPNGKPPPQAARGFDPRSEGEGKGVGSPLGGHRLNQFLSKRFIAQHQAPPQRFPLLGFLLPPSQFHPLLELSSPRPAVFARQKNLEKCA